MASNRYNYVLTESAEADIDEAFDYIADELVNSDAVSAFADELEDVMGNTMRRTCDDRWRNQQ